MLTCRPKGLLLYTLKCSGHDLPCCGVLGSRSGPRKSEGEARKQGVRPKDGQGGTDGDRESQERERERDRERERQTERERERQREREIVKERESMREIESGSERGSTFWNRFCLLSFGFSEGHVLSNAVFLRFSACI